MNFVDVVNSINKRLPWWYHFRLDRIWGYSYEKCLYDIVGENKNSIHNDAFALYPAGYMHSDIQCLNYKSQNIIKWINDKIFTVEINQLINGRLPLISTSLVRLRIAVNMISKIDTLPKEERDIWIKHIQDVYHLRRQAIEKVYLEDIIHLPF